MFSMKNGILYQDHKPVFCVGVSYYPSYHEKKVPVPQGGDRLGEMKTDLKRMKEAGFNLVRVASIGDVKREEEGIAIHTEFIDALLDEADVVDIATMVRLQGYSMNLSGYTDFYMLDENGNEMDKSIWYDFIQNSLHHEGIIRDNNDGTRALAEHYHQHKNLVSFQTYNEPHYPSRMIFDYHPAAIKVYRRWLVEQNLMEEEQAKNYRPPAQRPQKDEDPKPWIYWRMFAIDSLSKFLNHTANVAKQVDPSIESLTCLTTDPIKVWNAQRGVSYFDTGAGMDTVGITHYVNSYGAPYFDACLSLDNAESAAALYGKHCWLVEYDARTDITLRKFYEETYMAVGAGLKGIMYYQWRGDHIFPDSPEGNGFGFINCDGTPTNMYDEKMAMVNLLNELSDYIVNAEKKRCGVGILYSNYAFCHADALDNGKKIENNRFLSVYKDIYKQLRYEGITVDLVESRHLKENSLEIRVLYVSHYDLLSQREKDEIAEFMNKGGKVYTCRDGREFIDPTEVYDRNTAYCNALDTLEINNVEPVAASNVRSVMVQVIEGKDYALACINNISAKKVVQRDVVITLNAVSANSAELYTPYGKEQIRLKDGKAYISEIKEGGFLLLRK